MSTSVFAACVIVACIAGGLAVVGIVVVLAAALVHEVITRKWW